MCRMVSCMRGTRCQNRAFTHAIHKPAACTPSTSPLRANGTSACGVTHGLVAQIRPRVQRTCVCMSGLLRAISPSACAATSGGPCDESASQLISPETPPASAISCAAERGASGDAWLAIWAIATAACSLASIVLPESSKCTSGPMAFASLNAAAFSLDTPLSTAAALSCASCVQRAQV